MMCHLMAQSPSQLREMYHLSSLSAGQPRPSHCTSGRIKTDHAQKGFYLKKGRSLLSLSVIQSHISNRGQTTWHMVYLGCKPLEKGLTPCHHNPMTRNHWSLYKILRASALPGALWKPERQPESPQGLPGLCISKHAPQLVWAQQAIKPQIIYFTQIPSWKFKTKPEDVAPQLLKKVPATLRPHLLWSVPILRQHQVTCSSISSATRFGTWDECSLKVRSSQSLTVENQCNEWIYFSPLL